MAQRKRASARNSISESASSFVGRDGVLGSIEARFDDGARLVTLQAPGGMGKTRVATRFASSARGGFSTQGGGTFLVDLEAAKDEADLFRALATALGEALERSLDPARVARTLGHAIARRKRILVVLDGFEAVARDASDTLRLFMESAPEARWLITSRVALGIPGEHLVQIDPLGLPPPEAGEAEILASPAVELFVRRARGVRPEIDLGPEKLPLIAQIVQRTDGIPLAIELAAARLSVLSIPQLAARLSTSLDLLASRRTDGRHASMRRAVQDSISPLAASERLALARASVFRGGFTLEAAEATLADPPTQALAMLEALVSASLLRVREASGVSRFALFDVVRELAAEDLAIDPAEQLRAQARHATFYATVARDFDAPRSGEQPGDLAGLSAEIDNLMVAHDHELARAQKGDESALERALQLALTAGAALTPRGAVARHLDLLERTLAAAPRSTSPRLRARAELACGVARRELGDIEGAHESLQRGHALARSLEDPELESHALARLGDLVETSGRTAEAKSIFEDALRRLDQAPPGPSRRRLEADARARLAHALRREGALAEAERQIRRAIALHDSEEDPTPLLAMRYEAAVIALIRERHTEARERLEEAIHLAKHAGARHAQAAATSARGILLQETGKLEEALVDHAEAARIFRELGSRHREGSALFYFGAALLERGSPEDASRVLERASERMRTVKMPRYDALIAGTRAVAEATQGNEASASEWLERAEQAASACASEPTIRVGIEIHRQHIGLLLGHRSDIDACIRSAQGLAGQASNDDVRMALRLIEHFGQARPASPELRIEQDGSTLEFQGKRADLSRRAPLRRILLELARAHAERGAEALSMDELVQAGWPGERVGLVSAANRVRVALATLRKLGLKDAIVTAQGGYALDATLTVTIVGPGSPPLASKETGQDR